MNSFYVLRQALYNFKSFSEGQYRLVETGAESSDKGSFKLPEIYGGSGGAAPTSGPGGKKAEPAKGAKGSKDKKADPAAEEEAAKKAEAERRKQAEAEKDKLRVLTEMEDRRKHPHMFNWLRIKFNIVSILFGQKRYEDCADTIAVTRLECLTINCHLFNRKLKEIDF